LVVAVHGTAVRQIVDRIAHQVEHRAAKGDLALTLRNGKPYVAPRAFGRKLDTGTVVRHIVHELSANTRRPMHFRTTPVEPRALAAASHRVMIINRGQNLLCLYNGTTLWRQLPVPTGPANPLGTRWMGLSAPGVGIHGTPEPQSIGYSESHGCIRMLIPQVEWLFNHVDIGTTVFIV